MLALRCAIVGQIGACNNEPCPVYRIFSNTHWPFATEVTGDAPADTPADPDFHSASDALGRISKVARRMAILNMAYLLWWRVRV
jgi:hypothetical protein